MQSIDHKIVDLLADRCVFIVVSFTLDFGRQEFDFFVIVVDSESGCALSKNVFCYAFDMVVGKRKVFRFLQSVVTGQPLDLNSNMNDQVLKNNIRYLELIT